MMNSNYQSEKDRWRAANAGDSEAVEKYVNERSDGFKLPFKIREPSDFFTKAFNRFPEGCIVQTDNNAVIGFGTSYPWLLHDIPPPDNFSVVLPKSPDCLFIEDMTLTDHYTSDSYIPGNSVRDAFVEMMVEVALRQRLANIAIVYPPWNSSKRMALHGFEIAAISASNEKVKSRFWNAHNQYMIRKLK
jgi:hypothetical protein